MDGLVNWESSQTGDAERFSQDTNQTNGKSNSGETSFENYLRKKEISVSKTPIEFLSQYTVRDQLLSSPLTNNKTHIETYPNCVSAPCLVSKSLRLSFLDRF